MIDVSETALVKACLQLLKMHGIEAWRSNSGALKDFRGRLVRYGRPGSADITGILRDGRRLEIECKRPGKVPTEEQVKFIKMIREHGGVAWIVWSPTQLQDELCRLKGT